MTANSENQNKILKSQKGVRHKCRICWRLTGCVLLFNNELRPNIHQEIYSFTGVHIKQSNNLRDYICMYCVDLLDSCIRFRNMCRLNNDDLIQISVKQENYCGDNQITDSEDQYKLKKIEIIQKDDRTKFNNGDSDSIQLEDNVIREKTNNENEEDDFIKIVTPSTVPDTVRYYYKNVAIKRKCKKCMKVFNDLHCYFKHLKCQTIKDQKPTRVNPSIPSIPGPCFGPGNSKDEQIPHLCDTCGKTFNNYLSLRAHMVIHENVFPFKCDKCPYKGRTRSLLMSHVRSHLLTSERAYNCPHCSKITTTRTNLNAHIQRMHNTNERKYKCTHCEKIFKCKPDLKRHFVIVHENKGATKCEVCFKVFNKKHMKKHLWRIHKIQMEKSNLPNRLPSYILCSQTTEDEVVEEHGDNNIEENNIQWLS